MQQVHQQVAAEAAQQVHTSARRTSFPAGLHRSTRPRPANRGWRTSGAGALAQGAAPGGTRVTTWRRCSGAATWRSWATPTSATFTTTSWQRWEVSGGAGCEDPAPAPPRACKAGRRSGARACCTARAVALRRHLWWAFCQPLARFLRVLQGTLRQSRGRRPAHAQQGAARRRPGPPVADQHDALCQRNARVPAGVVSAALRCAAPRRAALLCGMLCMLCFVDDLLWRHAGNQQGF